MMSCQRRRSTTSLRIGTTSRPYRQRSTPRSPTGGRWTRTGRRKPLETKRSAIGPAGRSICPPGFTHRRLRLTVRTAISSRALVATPHSIVGSITGWQSGGAISTKQGNHFPRRTRSLMSERVPSRCGWIRGPANSKAVLVVSCGPTSPMGYAMRCDSNCPEAISSRSFCIRTVC